MALKTLLTLNMLTSFLVLLSMLLAKSEASSCPLRCECSPDLVSLVCSIDAEDDKDHLRLMPNQTKNLKLISTDNKLTELTRKTFVSITSTSNLTSLDLSGHAIGHIDEHLLSNLFPMLVSLNVSFNRLEVLASHTFRGLKRLETIDLSHNRIESLEDSSLDKLEQLKSLDVSKNPLTCDCNLQWFVDHVTKTNLSILNGDKTVCSKPMDMIDVTLMSIDKFVCSEQQQKRRQQEQREQEVVLDPSGAQVLFEGDPFQIDCHIDEMGHHQKILWLIRGTAVKPSSNQAIDIDEGSGKGRGLKVVLSVKSVDLSHSGQWACLVVDNDQKERRASIDILVLSLMSTTLCPPLEVETDKGVFHFPATINGMTAKQPCTSLGSSENTFATLQCDGKGNWMEMNSSAIDPISLPKYVVNDTECAYTRRTASTLHKFVTSMTNMSVSTDIGLNAVLDSARHLLNFTNEEEALFLDKTEAFLFLRALNTFKAFFGWKTSSLREGRLQPRQEELLAHYVLSLIASTMKESKKADLVWVEVNRAASSEVKLLSLVKELSHFCGGNGDFQHISQSLVMKTLEPLKRRFSFTTTCTWYYKTPDASALQSSSVASASFLLQRGLVQTRKKAFHCLDARRSHRILSRENKQLLASVTITTKRRRQQRSLVVVSLEYGAPSLFPSTLETSSVIGIVVPNDAGPSNDYNEDGYEEKEDEEFIVALRTDNGLNLTQLKPAFWDENSNEWLYDDSVCHSKPSVDSGGLNSDSVYSFTCTRLGFYTLIYQTSSKTSIAKTHESLRLLRSDKQQLLLHVGPAFSLLLLLITSGLYSLFFQDLRMTEGLRHCIINTQMSLATLLFLFASRGLLLGDNDLICATVAFVSHLTTLASLGWLTASAREVHAVANEANVKRLQDNDFLKSNAKDSRKDIDTNKRVGLYYLLVYGPSLLIATLTAVIESNNESNVFNDGYCFVSSDHLLLTIFTPCALMTALMTGLLLATWCLTTDPNQQLSNQICPMSADSHKTIRSLLLALAYVYLLLLSSYLCGALALTLPFESQLVPFQSHVLALLFTVSVASLGIFVFIYFAVSRPDVATCWQSPLFSTQLSDQKPLFEAPHTVSSMDETATTTHWPSLNRPAQLNGFVRDSSNTRGSGSSHDLGNQGFKIYSELHTEDKKDNDDEIERLSLSNFDHLRRGYVAPMNSEADYLVHNYQEERKRRGPQASLSNSSSLMSTADRQPGASGPNARVMGDFREEESNIRVVPNTLLQHNTKAQPSTSSPLFDNDGDGHGESKRMPVEFDVSPLVQCQSTETRSAKGHNKSTSAGDFGDLRSNSEDHRRRNKFASLDAQHSSANKANSGSWLRQVKSNRPCLRERQREKSSSSDSESGHHRHKRRRAQRRPSSNDGKGKKISKDVQSKSSSQMKDQQVDEDESKDLATTATAAPSSAMMNSQETSV